MKEAERALEEEKQEALAQGGPPPRTTLWALFAPPTLWALHFLFCYVYAATACALAGREASLDQVRVAIAVATAIALVLVALCGRTALREARIEGDPPPHTDSTLEDRRRFVAVATLLLAALSFVAIVFTALPAVFFGDCR